MHFNELTINDQDILSGFVSPVTFRAYQLDVSNESEYSDAVSCLRSGRGIVRGVTHSINHFADRKYNNDAERSLQIYEIY